MKNIFFNELQKQAILLSNDQFNTYLKDFIAYCDEMEFLTEEEIKDGAIEYVTCQIHYGIFN